MINLINVPTMLQWKETGANAQLLITKLKLLVLPSSGACPGVILKSLSINFISLRVSNLFRQG